MEVEIRVTVTVPDGIGSFMGYGTVASAMVNNIHQAMRDVRDVSGEIISAFEVTSEAPDGRTIGHGWTSPASPAPESDAGATARGTRDRDKATAPAAPPTPSTARGEFTDGVVVAELHPEELKSPPRAKRNSAGGGMTRPGTAPAVSRGNSRSGPRLGRPTVMEGYTADDGEPVKKWGPRGIGNLLQDGVRVYHGRTRVREVPEEIIREIAEKSGVPAAARPVAQAAPPKLPPRESSGMTGGAVRPFSGAKSRSKK